MENTTNKYVSRSQTRMSPDLINQDTYVNDDSNSVDLPPAEVDGDVDEQTENHVSTEGISISHDWFKIFDPKTNRHYYFNSKTRETTWANPFLYNSKIYRNQSIEVDDNNIWFEAKDNNSGQYYYFNKVTNEVTWKMPEGCVIMRFNSNNINDNDNNPTSRSLIKVKTKEKTNDNKVVTPEERRREAISIIRNQAHYKADVKTQDPDIIQTNSVKTGENEEKGQHHQYIKQFHFRTYAKRMFNLHRKGLFKRLTSLDRAINWKPKPIKHSLLSLNSSLSHLAVKLNQLIKTYTDGHVNQVSQYDILQRIVVILINSPPQLVDEAYCQLIKELTNCPKSHVLRCWKLFAVFAGSVTPNEELFPYIQFFVSKNRDTENETTRYADYVFRQLKKNLLIGKRAEIPTIAELSAILSLEMVYIRVYLVDDSCVTFECDSCTSVQDICTRMANKLKLSTDGSLFGLYESLDPNSEKLLSQKQRLLDVLSRWQSQYTYDEYDYTNSNVCRFVYKTVLYVDTNPDIVYSTYLIYIQGLYDIFNEHYSCSDDDYYTLAALALQTASANNDSIVIDDDAICEVIPWSLRKDEQTLQQSKKIIITLYSKLRGYSFSESMNTYIDYIKAWDFYGFYYFYVESASNSTLPGNLYLAVGPRGITLGDEETKTPLKTIPYSSIPSWGYNKQAFIMHVGSLIQQDKYIFSTIEGEDINNLMNSYVQYLVNNKTQTSLF